MQLTEGFSSMQEQGKSIAVISTQENVKAVQILESLGDDAAFKSTMLMAKRQKREGSNREVLDRIMSTKGDLDIDSSIAQISDLLKGFDNLEGYEKVGDDADLVMFLKQRA